LWFVVTSLHGFGVLDGFDPFKCYLSLFSIWKLIRLYLLNHFMGVNDFAANPWRGIAKYRLDKRADSGKISLIQEYMARRVIMPCHADLAVTELDWSVPCLVYLFPHAKVPWLVEENRAYVYVINTTADLDLKST
jgi:hypothetical protein